MNKALVVINETHKLLPSQVEQLNSTFHPDGWEIFRVPEAGWTKEEQTNLLIDLIPLQVVFASPVPLLLAWIAAEKCRFDPDLFPIGLWVFHNDLRIAKEVPDGKGGVRIIHTVSPEGWQLIAI